MLFDVGQDVMLPRVSSDHLKHVMVPGKSPGKTYLCGVFFTNGVP